ncbi:bacitracin ABC transporter ATP-binding protein [Paenibacillus sp. CAA11]|uniref:ABC transporter ATP-binding protein n=1 Tax=Paenibacillus sp. CAA11 TaxID=1532905 RepID=UPI000D357AFD|nr:ABC transporter ATP-binding protein [Paenibacillus sp. CAA11]AWB44084.1 bacitracin ABC transporter ATP-binding protein [Paenibacillus sp. CAA11]
MDILRVDALHKVYPGKVQTHALKNIEFTIGEGEFVGIMGPSGSGKTTLLNMVSTIDAPSSGNVWIGGENPYTLKRRELARFRRRKLGFVFQDFNLLDTLTLAENIILPLTLDKIPYKEMQLRLKTIAERLDITQILNKRTYEVSGGQKQRAAIARAMIHSPALLLADEPTGALDSASSRNVMEMLESLNKSQGTTMMLVSHDPLAASYCDRVLFIRDGSLYNEIYKGESRQEFFQKILEMLSFLGGNAHELSSIRV